MLSWFQVLMRINRIDVILFYIEYSNLLSEQIDISCRVDAMPLLLDPTYLGLCVNLKFVGPT